MYLSKVYIDWSLSRNLYRIHQQLWMLFPNRPDATRDFLFRIEMERAGQGVLLLMLSELEPDGSVEKITLQATKAWSPVVAQGHSLRFILTANPIKTIKDEMGRINSKGEVKKCRVPLLGGESQQHWLARKLNGAATLNSVVVRNNRPIYFRKQLSAGKIVPITFEGVLTVENSERFLQQIKQGIGPAKAFGCGLMMVRRL